MLLILEIPMKDFNAQSTVQDYARKLDAIYQVHGREGLKGYNASDVAVLYWCVQQEINIVSDRIESGEGREVDLLRKELLNAQREDLRADLLERTEREERGIER